MIKIDAINAGYSRKNVIKNISAKFGSGEVCAIIGANGSGKSTLLKACCGLIKVSAGQIFIGGKSIDVVKRLYTQISYLYQYANGNSFSVNNTSVAEFVLRGRFPHSGFTARYSPKDHAFAMSAINKFNLEGLRDCKISSISGGERRRAELAQLHTQDCEYVFMDEPTNFLDAACRAITEQYIRELREAGRTVILVSHDINQACDLADRILLLHDGAIAAEFERSQFGSPEFLQNVSSVLSANITRGIFYGFA